MSEVVSTGDPIPRRVSSVWDYWCYHCNATGEIRVLKRVWYRRCPVCKGTARNPNPPAQGGLAHE